MSLNKIILFYGLEKKKTQKQLLFGLDFVWTVSAFWLLKVGTSVYLQNVSEHQKISDPLSYFFCSRCRTIIVIEIYLCQVFRCRLNTLQLSLLVASLDFVTQQKSPPLNRSANNCGIVFSSFIPLFFFVVSFIYWLKCHSKWYVGPFIPSMFCGAGKSLKTDLSLKPFANTTHLSFSCEIVK